MSSLASTQIPKPSDEQAFERANVVLWRHLLNDPNVQRNGRRGQRQKGVDLFGVRDGNLSHHVGIQCKLKAHHQELTEAEVRGEINKALTFVPALREYFIVTTSPDDVALQELVRTIATELFANGRTMAISVWGWNTLEERIAEHSASRKAFDPTFTPQSDDILSAVKQVMAAQGEISVDVAAGMSRIQSQLVHITQTISVAPNDATTVGTAFEAHLDAEIDTYRDMLNDGRAKTALQLLTGLLGRVGDGASGRIIFRIKSNIGFCHQAFGDLATAADLLSEAYHHAPAEPKAIANQAFALLLKEQWQEALQFANEALENDRANEVLAGYLIQAASRDPSVEQPLSLVPSALHQTAPVLIAVTHWLRQRSGSPDWHAAAHRAAELHPGDRQLQLLSAEAVLDEIIEDRAHKETGSFTPAQVARASSAAEVLATEWKQAQTRESGIGEAHAGICSNLILAYRMIGDLAAATEIARQGRAAAPSNTDIARRAVVVGMESGDFAMASAALASLPADADTTALAVGMHAQNGDWQQVSELTKEIPEGLTQHDRLNLTTLGRVSAIKLAAPAARRSLLEALVADTAADVSASLITIQAARTEKAEDLCDKVYSTLLQMVGESTHRAERYGIAHHAAMRHEWASVADLLDGHVSEERHSEELELLARAYVNERPMRERGVRFFERLPDALRAVPLYLEAGALFHFNRGDLFQAEAALRETVKVSATTQSHLALISTLRRRGHSEEIGELLAEVDVESLRGPPAERISIAAELRALGRGPDAMRIAYAVLSAAKNDPDAALRYVGLVMSDQDAQLIPMPDAVTADCWVQLDSPDSDAAQSFLITDGADRPADGVIGLTHPMALKCFGLKVGDTFQLEPGIGQRTTWRVAKFLHKYHHALHDVMENFEHWFPNAQGLWKFSMKDNGDISPFLDQIKAFGEQDRTLADLYLEKHLPLAMVAGRTGRECIGFAEYIRALGKSIEACIGTDPERAAARALISQHRQSTLVMDTYTAWVAATADLLDVIAKMFASVAIPQSVIDDLTALKTKHSSARSESMTVSWIEGQFIRQDLTSEDISRHQSYIDEQIARLKGSCRVVPVAAPDQMSEVAKLITSSFGTHVLDPAFLTSSTKGLLLSEDMYFRQIANAAIPVGGVWLQPILLAAREEGLIDPARYTNALVLLASRGHAHLSLSAADLLAVFKQDDGEQLWRFAGVADFLGVPGADMLSHAAVVRQFLNEIWRQDIPRMKRGKATGILLQRLVSNRSASWEVPLAYIYGNGNGDLRTYVERWIIGHMLPIASFRTKLKPFGL